MAQPRPTETAPRLTGVQWLICVIAALGFAFDTYELLVLPLIVRPALMEMAKIKPGTPEFNLWVGLLFYIPAVRAEYSACWAAISRIAWGAGVCWSGAF